MTTIKDALAKSANVEDINGTGDFTGRKVGVFAALAAAEGSEPETETTVAEQRLQVRTTQLSALFQTIQ